MASECPIANIDEACRIGIARLVKIDEVKHLDINTNSPNVLATKNLNGGTAVAVVAHLGVVLTHICPRAPHSNPYEATGDGHVRLMMDRLMIKLDQHAGDFQGSVLYSAVFCPVFEGAIALPDQVDYITGLLAAKGLKPRVFTYEVRPSYALGSMDGTVVVDTQQSPAYAYQPARVYLGGSRVI